VLYFSQQIKLAINQTNIMKPVIIYSTPTCTYCKAAKDYFAKNNVAFTEYNVASDEVRRKEMVDKTGQLGVPVITIGETVIVGFDQPAIATALGK
jgi:glutaredoxin-like YruB-family protein